LRGGGGSRIIRTADGPNDFRSSDVAPDGRLVAAGNFAPRQGGLGNACVWDSRSGELEKSLPVGGFCAVRFGTRGKWFATASASDHVCQLWRVADWQAGPSFSADQLPAFSPDDTIMAISGECGQVQLIETSTGRSFATLTSRELTLLTPQCFSPDG